jgi:hypothetical protein
MEHWQTNFNRLLIQSDRAYVSVLREVRTTRAYADAMSSDATDRHIDIAVRRCRNINATEQSEPIRTLREELQPQA